MAGNHAVHRTAITDEQPADVIDSFAHTPDGRFGIIGKNGDAPSAEGVVLIVFADELPEAAFARG